MNPWHLMDHINEQNGQGLQEAHWASELIVLDLGEARLVLSQRGCPGLPV